MRAHKKLVAEAAVTLEFGLFNAGLLAAQANTPTARAHGRALPPGLRAQARGTQVEQTLTSNVRPRDGSFSSFPDKEGG